MYALRKEINRCCVENFLAYNLKVNPTSHPHVLVRVLLRTSTLAQPKVEAFNQTKAFLRNF